MNKKRQQKQRDITLMTVLAYEATADSQKILKKYGREPGKGYSDLEVKLANLYFDTQDKVQLEKELAEIHPHKKWLLEHTEPIVKIKEKEVQIEIKPDEKSLKEIEELKKQLDAKMESQKMEDFKNEMKKALQDEFNKAEMKSGFQGNMSGNSYYSQCRACAMPMSNFAGNVDNTQKETKSDISPYVGLIGIFAIVGLTFIAIQKNK
jgi:superfamily II RNA helicase